MNRLLSKLEHLQLVSEFGLYNHLETFNVQMTLCTLSLCISTYIIVKLVWYISNWYFTNKHYDMTDKVIYWMPPLIIVRIPCPKISWINGFLTGYLHKAKWAKMSDTMFDWPRTQWLSSTNHQLSLWLAPPSPVKLYSTLICEVQMSILLD